MIYWTSKKNYALIISMPRGTTKTLYPGDVVEGEYFRTFPSILVEVEEAKVDKSKVVYSQTNSEKAAKGFFQTSSTPVSTPDSEPVVEPLASPASEEPVKAPEAASEAPTEAKTGDSNPSDPKNGKKAKAKE